MSEKNLTVGDVSDNKKESNTKETMCKIKILENRDVLYGTKILTFNAGDTVSVSEELKRRLVRCGSAQAV
jgi:hypothetical protein